VLWGAIYPGGDAGFPELGVAAHRDSCLLPPPLGSGNRQGHLATLGGRILAAGFSTTACTNSLSGVRDGSSCVFSESRCTVRRNAAIG